jgi:hypothetical protein
MATSAKSMQRGAGQRQFLLHAFAPLANPLSAAIPQADVGEQLLGAR